MGVKWSGLVWASTLALASSVSAQSISAPPTIEQYLSGPTAQVTSVSELSDVEPDSWAFQSLKSVVERYGCLEGYPNKTYRGNKSLSRFEFAAGLNACLEKVYQLIASGQSNLASSDDIATLRKLQSEFRSELTELRGQVDVLQTKTQKLEAQQFSTTTKLSGSVVAAVTGGSSSGTVFSGTALGIGPAYGDALGAKAISGSAANTTAVARTTLNLKTSFSENDELLIRLRGTTGQSIDATYPGIASGFGTLFYAGFDGSLTGPQPTNGLANVSIDKVRYIKRFSPNFRAFIGPRIEMFEFIDNNSFANNDEADFSSGRFIVSPLVNFVPFGSGGGFDWDITPWLNWRALYLGANAGASQAFGSGGLTGGSNMFSTQLKFELSKTAAFRLIYSRFGEQGAALGTALPGVIDNSYTDVFAANWEWAISPQFAFFGRAGFGSTNVNTYAGSGINFSNLNSNIWRVGVSLPDLFGEGNALGITYGNALRVNSGSVTGLEGPGETTSLVPSGREGEIEAFYRFRVTDRISITPDIQWIFQPVNASNSSTLTVFTLRTVFNF